MKQMWVLVLLVCGGLMALSSFGPRATAAPADAGAAPLFNIRPGDDVRLCLDRSRSGDTGWLGGVVKEVSLHHVLLSASINDPVTLPNGGSGLVRRKVEQWVPMTSILYIEKMLDGTAEQTP